MKKVLIGVGKFVLSSLEGTLRGLTLVALVFIHVLALQYFGEQVLKTNGSADAIRVIAFTFLCSVLYLSWLLLGRPLYQMAVEAYNKRRKKGGDNGKPKDPVNLK